MHMQTHELIRLLCLTLMSDEFSVHACRIAAAQVTTMRKEAQEYRTQLLNEIKASKPEVSSSSSSSSDISRSIKAKLINAVEVMQEGLVEREAEVGGVCNKFLGIVVSRKDLPPAYPHVSLFHLP